MGFLMACGGPFRARRKSFDGALMDEDGAAIKTALQVDLALYSSGSVFATGGADLPDPRLTLRRIMPKSAPPVANAVMK